MTMSLNSNGIALSTFVIRICPVCHHNIVPIAKTNEILGTNAAMQIVQCTNDECRAIYVGYSPIDVNAEYWDSTVKKTYPALVDAFDIPSEIREKYPDFYGIFTQAMQAEAMSLTDIAGMAYRKAVEFLVKDYAISLDPNDEAKIIKESASDTIKRLAIPEIKTLSKGISWIGNDETHMFQKHPDYSVPEMKQFIYALCHLIVAFDIADSANDLLNEKPQK